MISRSSGKPVVVGVDGSAAGREALHWAVRQARVSELPLRAVIVWQWPPGYGRMPPAIGAQLRRDSAEVLSTMLSQVLDQVTEQLPDARCEQVVREGRPAEVLLEESAGAALLVVGSRGRDAFVGMLLGSVSAHCISHADCPVVVVRETSAVTDDEEDPCVPQTS